jgi:tight adherence protein B
VKPFLLSQVPRFFATNSHPAMQGMGFTLHKLFVMAFIFVGTALLVYRAVDDPRGLTRRFFAGYVARLDTQQRSMFLVPSGAKIAWTQFAVVLIVLTLYGVFPSGALLACAAFCVIVPSIYVSRQVVRRRATIDAQANGFALALSNSLKATSSIGDALKGASDVTAKPLQDEIATVLRQIRVGSTLEEALLALSARVQSSALDVVVSALLIGRQTGGDLPRILEGTSASLRDLKRLEELTDKVTRGAKQSLLLSAAMTAGLVALLPYLFPGFLEPLRTTVKGQVYALQMVLVYLVALYLGFRITRKSV